MNRPHHMTPTKTHYRSFTFGKDDNGHYATVFHEHKDHGREYRDTYRIERLPDTDTGVLRFRLTLTGGMPPHEIHHGMYPHCTCESWRHSRGNYCKHLTIVEQFCNEQGIGSPVPTKEKHDFTRAEGELV